MEYTFLFRDDAPFGEKVWNLIDNTVVNTAKQQLTARRLLHTEGSYGFGTQSLNIGSDEVTEKVAESLSVNVGRSAPITSIQRSFTLPMRDIAYFEETGLPINLSSAKEAAIECAQQEDAILLNGLPKHNLSGLLTASGINKMKTGTWNEIGMAADDIIKSVTMLDKAGFHGPYTLGLTPEKYNLLYRRFQQGNQTELEHLGQIVNGGIVKVPGIQKSGILLASGKQFASIIVGQDLMTGFTGPDGDCLAFSLTESIALMLIEPKAVCVLE